MTHLLDAIEDVVANHHFGRASAVKRGRNKRWPYVPIVDYGELEIGVDRTRTEQLRGKAFVTREEAVQCAQRVIDARREELRSKLRSPNHRALREWYGLPREI